MACSRLWSDISIRCRERTLGACCKSQTMSSPTIQQIKDMGGKIFTLNQEILADKMVMVKENILPKGCHQCADNWPHSYWQEWNVWQNKPWTQDELDGLPYKDHSYRAEIYLSNICNLSCMYCNSFYSSAWAKIQNHAVKGEGQEEWRQEILKAFVEYTEALGDRRMELTFVGGEPFLDPKFMEITQGIMERRGRFRHKTRIFVVTNLSVPTLLIEKFLKMTMDYPEVQWEVCPSIENVAQIGLEIRDGINFDLFEKNLDILLRSKAIKVSFGPAVSCLSVVDYSDFLIWMLEKTKAHGKIFGSDWSIITNTVVSPVAMHPGVLPATYSEYIENAIGTMKRSYPNNQATEKYLSYLENLKALIGSRRDPQLLAEAREWYVEQGRIKNKDYFSLFPVLSEIF